MLGKGRSFKEAILLSFTEFIGKNHARFNRMWLFAGIVNGLVNVVTLAIVQKQYFGLSILQAIFLVSFVMLVVPWIIVFSEERKNQEDQSVWGEETLHIWKLAGWDPIKLNKDVVEIKEMLKCK